MTIDNWHTHTHTHEKRREREREREREFRSESVSLTHSLTHFFNGQPIEKKGGEKSFNGQCVVAKKSKKITALRVPRLSPTLVLTEPEEA